ncbi:hypothetical protein CHARACLAT_031443 [Characodon lateralis]|uniref:Uncharacterized protein n=1 Tax=Characodon lateralis TaxID=208331 RepID=A0ABU7DQ56_9TELE|nr:hypothetical protein [Characodon lateralis]
MIALVIFCYIWKVCKAEELLKDNKMAGRRLQFTRKLLWEMCLSNQLQPAIDEKTLITAMNGLSRQITQFSTEVNQQ